MDIEYTDKSSKKEIECIYKDEVYSVRDNGAVMRHLRDGKRIRKDDNNWIWGKLNTKTSFLEIGGVRVHQIIVTAFWGNAPTKQHVVIHINTDRRNNRPENLRWVTKFENVILTPYNCEKIRILCGGSIEKILKDVSVLENIDLPPNFAWIKEIRQEEAALAHKHLLEIAKDDRRNSFTSLDAWLNYRYEIQNRFEDDIVEEDTDKTKSLTENAIQISWYVPSEFPCCPQGSVVDPIIAYYENLNKGSLLCKNNLYQSIVLDKALSEDNMTILVAAESTDVAKAIKPWALAKITYEESVYMHYSLGSYFELNGVNKYFCLAQGKEWTGEDSIDDYC